MLTMTLTPIGIIHSPHKQATGTPIQAAVAAGVRGTVEVFPESATGLRDLDGFERIWLVYWFDRAKPADLVVTPYLDTTPRGLFATRAPCRPNPVGLSPVVCDVLHHVQDRAGWLKKAVSEMKPGARFVLIEFKEGKLPEGPPEAAKITRKQLLELVTQGGLALEAEKADLLPYQVFLVFRKGV